MITFFGSRRSVTDYFPDQVYLELFLRVREGVKLPYDEMMRLDAFISMWVERVHCREGEAYDPEGAREMCELVEAALVALVYPTSMETPHRELKGKWCSFRNLFLYGGALAVPDESNTSTDVCSHEASEVLVHQAINNHQGVLSHKILVDIVGKKIENFTTHDLARSLYFMEACGEITIKKSGSDYLVIPVTGD